MQDVMEEHEFKLKDPSSFRWLALERVVATVHKCYGAIVSCLQSIKGKNTIGDVIADGFTQGSSPLQISSLHSSSK